jgi:hypothetical protein
MPTSTNPLGVKGAGEAGTVGSLSAGVNAIVDALSALGIRHIDMPCTPYWVWQAIQGARTRDLDKARPIDVWGPSGSGGRSRCWLDFITYVYRHMCGEAESGCGGWPFRCIAARLSSQPEYRAAAAD